jgi:hypothetical protein
MPCFTRLQIGLHFVVVVSSRSQREVLPTHCDKCCSMGKNAFRNIVSGQHTCPFVCGQHTCLFLDGMYVHNAYYE